MSSDKVSRTETSPGNSCQSLTTFANFVNVQKCAKIEAKFGTFAKFRFSDFNYILKGG